MKKLLFAFLVLMCGVASGQTIMGDNPYKVDPSSTDTFYIDLSNFTHHKVNGFFEITVRTPTGNVGNVRINSERADMTNAPDLPESTIVIIRFSGTRLYFDFDNAADLAWITF